MVQIQSGDAAVSPVIGVMLMLVVTIIIAAVVSAFAGSLVGGIDKAPQVALGAKLVSAGNLTLIHKGGDSLIWQNTEIRTIIVSGRNKDMTHTLNLTTGWYIPTAQPIYNGAVWPAWAPVFKNGDEITFLFIDAFGTFGSLYPGPATPSIGDQVDIQIFDKASGKMIVTTRVSTSGTSDPSTGMSGPPPGYGAVTESTALVWRVGDAGLTTLT